MSLSPDGKFFATWGADKKIRVFRFLMGKLYCVIDESLHHYIGVQQNKSMMPSMEFNRKVEWWQLWCFKLLISLYFFIFWRSHVIISKCFIFGVLGCVRLFSLVKKSNFTKWPWKYFYFKKKIFNSEQNFMKVVFLFHNIILNFMKMK